ncbi:hypothetical protein CEXT_381311 [Caerostris extrusa]|uniref:Uncharacterized protein n=1 Tax=Caerostris extrusa TaxID=172846 RepID=A0AAV4UQJ5_CAEEX|nr:hypothetical protein CEXT_381311 [Caerostris extrusa]
MPEKIFSHRKVQHKEDCGRPKGMFKLEVTTIVITPLAESYTPLAASYTPLALTIRCVIRITITTQFIVDDSFM